LTAIRLRPGQTDFTNIGVFSCIMHAFRSKGDFDGAITQYLETIKYVEPSYGQRWALLAAAASQDCSCL
jgi:hypothetical protein